MDDSGTIDITGVVNFMQSSFVTLGTDFVFTALVGTAYMSWVSLPIINSLVKMFIKFVLNKVSLMVETQAFFMNTAIRKASQAQDFVNATNELQSLPTTVSDAEYEKAEQTQMLAFRNFVMVTN